MSLKTPNRKYRRKRSHAHSDNHHTTIQTVCKFRNYTREHRERCHPDNHKRNKEIELKTNESIEIPTQKPTRKDATAKLNPTHFASKQACNQKLRRTCSPFGPEVVTDSEGEVREEGEGVCGGVVCVCVCACGCAYACVSTCAIISAYSMIGAPWSTAADHFTRSSSGLSND